MLLWLLALGLAHGYSLTPNVQWLQTRAPSAPFRLPPVIDPGSTQSKAWSAAPLVYALPVSALATLSVVSMRSSAGGSTSRARAPPPSCLAVGYRESRGEDDPSDAVLQASRPRSARTSLSMLSSAASANSAHKDSDCVDELQGQISRVIESFQQKMSFLIANGDKASRQAQQGGLSHENEILLAKAVEAGEMARSTLEEGGWTTRVQKARLQSAIRNAEEAEKIFVLANVGLVKSIVYKQSRKISARSGQTYSASKEDLEQAGYMGLLKALRNFDWRRGFRFSTYAYYSISKEVGAAQAYDTMIRVPVNRYNEIKKVQQLYKEMTESLEREPTFKEMADKIGFTAGRIEEDLQLVKRYVGLFPREDIERISDLQTVGDWTRVLLPWDALEEKISSEKLIAYMEVLDSSERTALQMRFGLNGEREHTYKQIEGALNLKPTAGYRFTQRAIKKIRKAERARGGSL